MRRATDLATGTGWRQRWPSAAGVGVDVVDVGMSDASDRVPDRDRTPHRAAGSTSRTPWTTTTSSAAVATGRRLADAEVDAGADLLIGAVCGVGVSTPVAALTAALTGMEPVDATSRGSGIDDEGWIRKAAAVRDALFRVRSGDTDVLSMLRVGGGPDLAALTGFVAQAAIRRTPVMIHDMPSTVAAVLAHRLAPGADNYLLAFLAGPGSRASPAARPDRPRAADRLVDHRAYRGRRAPGGAGAAGRGGAFDAIDRTARPVRSADAISTWDATLL